MAADRRFRVMGSTAHVVLDGDRRLLDLAEGMLRRLEASWSRFLPTSEVSRLNAAGGDLVAVSPETYRLIALGVEGWAATAGRFDPTVLGDVIRAGYDRSYEQVPAERSAPPDSALHRGAGGIVLVPSLPAVRLPPGTGFDPGGIGKGLAADLVTAALVEAGAEGACVNVGGDLRAAGHHDGEARWVVAVDPAECGRPVATIAIGAGAVATSTATRRTWTVAGSPATT